MKRFPWLLLVMFGVLVTGCGPNKDETAARKGVGLYALGDFRGSIAVLKPLAENPDRHYVLNNLRLGSAQLAAREFEEAEYSFLRAYEVMNATRVNDAARQVQAVVFSESARIWRGEPYERALANMSLGLLFYQRGDINNARAAFENALFKLRDYADPKNKPEKFSEVENNLPLALLMLGRCFQMIGESQLAEASLSQLIDARPEFQDLAEAIFDRSNNVLIVVEQGMGPTKSRSQDDGSLIEFLPLPTNAPPIFRPELRVNGRSLDVGAMNLPTFDSIAMAQDRRWQSIDTIRVTKSVVGTGMIIGGAATTAYGIDRGDSGTALVGLGVMAAGALLKASSQADVRHWEAAPRTAFVLPIRLPPGRHDIDIRFPGAAHLNQSWKNIEVQTGRDTMLYIRAINATAGTFDASRPIAPAPFDGSFGTSPNDAARSERLDR